MTYDVQHPSCVARITIHRPSYIRRATVAGVFLVLYAVAGQWCYTTSGEPLAFAQKEIAAQEAAREEALQNRTTENVTKTTEDLLAELAEVEAEPHHSQVDEDGNPLNVTGNATMDRPKPLPSWWLPNAWAGALFFAVCTCNALFFLLGFWMVWFKADSLYEPATGVSDGAYVFVHTHAHKGKAALVPLKRSDVWPCRPHRSSPSNPVLT